MLSWKLLGFASEESVESSSTSGDPYNIDRQKRSYTKGSSCTPLVEVYKWNCKLIASLEFLKLDLFLNGSLQTYQSLNHQGTRRYLWLLATQVLSTCMKPEQEKIPETNPEPSQNHLRILIVVEIPRTRNGGTPIPMVAFMIALPCLNPSRIRDHYPLKLHSFTILHHSYLRSAVLVSAGAPYITCFERKIRTRPTGASQKSVRRLDKRSPDIPAGGINLQWLNLPGKRALKYIH